MTRRLRRRLLRVLGPLAVPLSWALLGVSLVVVIGLLPPLVLLRVQDPLGTMLTALVLLVTALLAVLDVEDLGGD